MAGSENTTALPFARLPRETIETIIEAALAELDAREGDPDLEPEVDCCEANDDDPSSMRLEVKGYPGDPGDAEDNGDNEPNGDEEHDPAEYERWFTPEWHVSAALSPVTPLFIRSTVA